MKKEFCVSILYIIGHLSKNLFQNLSSVHTKYVSSDLENFMLIAHSVPKLQLLL